jgi:hypothetical protein
VGLLSQLETSKPKTVTNWLDAFILIMQKSISSSKNFDKRDLAESTIDVLLEHRQDIISLGLEGLTIFLQKATTGLNEDAYLFYVKQSASFDDLIADQESDFLDLVKRKQRLDLFKEKAIKFLAALTLEGARLLIPFLLMAL